MKLNLDKYTKINKEVANKARKLFPKECLGKTDFEIVLFVIKKAKEEKENKKAQIYKEEPIT